MLTSDLVRAQVRKDVLVPRWVDPASAGLREDAAALVALFAAHVGRTAGELDEAIMDLAALRTDVLLVRGLAKLLWDRATTGVPELVAASGEVIAPSAARAALFRAAGAAWPVRPGGGGSFTAREALVAEVAAALGVTPDALEAGLYADLGDAQRVLSVESPAPEALLERYNMALAQACLLRAREVRVTLPEPDSKRTRALFRELKFRRLLFRAEATDDSHAGAGRGHPGEAGPSGRGVRLVLDGPLSLFKQTSRYGIALAQFLPALTRAERWSLEADVTWQRGAAKGRDVTLRLDQKAPLVASGRDTGTWTSAEEEHFEKAFAAHDTPWKLVREARVVDLDGRDVLVPDYALVHPDGREALVELVFAWRKKTFEKKLALLAAHGPQGLVVALADKGGLDDEALPEGLAAYRFKGVIAPKRILALAEEVARPVEGKGKAARKRKT